MSSVPRHGRGRTAAVALVGATLVALLLPLVIAQESATLVIEPATAEPSTALLATFTVPSTLPAADVSVQDRVTCIIIGADGETAACDLVGAPLNMRVLPGAIVYTIPLVAPATTGAYEIRVARAPIADAPILLAEATAALTVAPPVALEPAGDDTPDATVPSPDGGNTNIWNVFFGADDAAQGAPDAEADGKDDAARWMVSATAGTGTLLLLLVGSRGGLGGLP